MKKTLYRVFLMVMIFAVCLSAAAMAETATEVDYSPYPESFAEWDANILASYLRSIGLIETSGYVVPLSEGDAAAMDAVGGFIYTTADGSIMDMFFFIDPTNEELLAAIRENQAIIPGGMEDNALAMDGMIGNMVFSYSLGLDDDHMVALFDALTVLADHFGIEPGFMLPPILD